MLTVQDGPNIPGDADALPADEPEVGDDAVILPSNDPVVHYYVQMY